MASIKIKDLPLRKSSTIYSSRVVGGLCVEKTPGCQTGCEGENVPNCPLNCNRAQIKY